ncbi:TadE/TadG family type IV pilus assembly protein [Phyllobacterium bourgognense]|uniref:Flp pilus assembly protein TadG n=1 Tax=Phyllobacterium bourgognense TaxID=314236 RepID=A0A368Z4S6_9HYPH|nr:TadE/TadG family type IV pilus assembly protein [Phyllobacterium bourgognense]RCW87453.1 Flp pilus assembly protein TadG [Phyllobacterium bourgognense]
MFGKIHKLFGLRHTAEATDVPKGARGSTAARFFANKRGTVAIEFALIALPFFLLVFAIIEVSLSFTAQQVMANTTDDIARQLRTGEIKTLNLAQLKQKVCAGLLMPAANCPDLFVDLRTYTTFALVPKTIPLKATGDVDSTGFTSAPGGAGTINQLRVFYRWPIFTDLMKPRIANIDGTGKILLFSTATWKNEPYL